jgi:hypothetical protein
MSVEVTWESTAGRKVCVSLRQSEDRDECSILHMPVRDVDIEAEILSNFVAVGGFVTSKIGVSVKSDELRQTQARKSVSIRLPGVYNAVDDHPARRDDLAESIRTKSPLVAAVYDRRTPSTGKRVNNAKLKSTGWTPQYPSVLDALPSL